MMIQNFMDMSSKVFFSAVPPVFFVTWIVGFIILVSLLAFECEKAVNFSYPNRQS